MEEYLAKFKSTLIERLAAAIESDLQNDPDCAKGRKKTVQVRKPLPLSYSALFCNPIYYYLGNIPRTLHALDVPEGAPTHGLLVTRGTRGCGE